MTLADARVSLLASIYSLNIMALMTLFLRRLAAASLCILFASASRANEATTNVLVLIHSDSGRTYELAKSIAEGIEHDGRARAAIKLVSPSSHPSLARLSVASVEELTWYDGIAIGTPVYFAGMSTAMSEFWAKTVPLWTRHELEGIPATTFLSAGSGAGLEVASQSLWNTLASHGMVLVSNGMRGMDEVDRSTVQGMTIFGAGALSSPQHGAGPSESERRIALLQGMNFAAVAEALKGTREPSLRLDGAGVQAPPRHKVRASELTLPPAPKPVGNYVPFARSGNLVYINQVALVGGGIAVPGRVGHEVTEEQAMEATGATMLNVLAVLKDALGGDLDRVVRVVQLTGFFNTAEYYADHARLMNPASDLVVEVFGDRGKHARATVGASSLPLQSPVEIQAVFEVR